MINIYDIILNFSDTRIYEFFEWNKNDEIDHIKKTVLYKVSSKMIKDIISNNIIVDNSFLKKIYNKTEVFYKSSVVYIDYCAIFSDGNKSVAVEFNDMGHSIYKSFMLLDEEEEVLLLADTLELTDISYKIKKKISNKLFLTRKEEFIKNYLIMDLNKAYQDKNYTKINYIYDECFKNHHKKIEEKYTFLVNDLSNNFSSKYIQLFNLLKLSLRNKAK